MNDASERIAAAKEFYILSVWPGGGIKVYLLLTDQGGYIEASDQFSALIFVSCASTSITSRSPSTMTELTENWPSGEVNTLIEILC